MKEKIIKKLKEQTKKMNILILFFENNNLINDYPEQYNLLKQVYESNNEILEMLDY